MHSLPGFERLFSFEADCKQKILEFMRSSSSLSPSAINIFAHMLAAERMWLSRLELETKAPTLGNLSELWPGKTLDQCADELKDVTEHWTRYLAGRSAEDFSKEISYINVKGQTVSKPPYDILTQIVIHSAYHRGQIAAVAGKGEREAPPMDYIFFAP